MGRSGCGSDGASVSLSASLSSPSSSPSSPTLLKRLTMRPLPLVHRLVLIVLMNAFISTSLPGHASLLVSATKEDVGGSYGGPDPGDYGNAGAGLGLGLGYDVDDSPNYVAENNLGNLCQLLYNARFPLPKRNFNPWGGKRSALGFSPECEYYRQIANSGVGKRGQFNPWGGKRTPGDGGSSDGRSNRVAKNDKNRVAFNPWGGKK